MAVTSSDSFCIRQPLSLCRNTSQKPNCITPSHSSAYHRTWLSNLFGRLWLRAVRHCQCYSSSPWRRSQQTVLKKVVTVDFFDIYCICRMPEMIEDEKWGECTKCLRWYHTDKCLNISQEGDWVCLTVYLRYISSILYHELYFYPCTCIFVTCMSFMHFWRTYTVLFLLA